MMLRRPRPGETDEDLLQEEEDLISQGALKSSVTLIKPDKRKTGNSNSTHSTEASDGPVPRSRFGRQRAAKKQKEGIIDNTILKEAVKREGRAAVLGRVVERLVPNDPTQYQWQPTPSPYGFPHAVKLDNLSESPSTTSGPKKKSLYMQQVEKQQGTAEKATAADTSASTATPLPPTLAAYATSDPRLAALGSCSYVIKGLDTSEAEKIHEENMAKLANMSHEERLREQQSLLASLTPEQIAFFRSLRNLKTSRPQRSKETLKQEERKVEDKPDSKLQSSDRSQGLHKLHSSSVPAASGVGDDGTQGKQSNSQKKSTPVSQHSEMDCEDAETDTGQVHVKSPENNAQSSSLWASKRKQSGEAGELRYPAEKKVAGNEESECEIVESELPIPPSEAKHWLNMGKVEYEKLRWMTEMPSPRPLKNNEGFVARFSFEGDILPYNCDISYRKALHHHGEEPGRAGYTIDEVFTHIRSKVLQQRHVGLRTLANILRNAKEGLYDTCVNPPVTQLVVEAGGVLLLRFALDDSSHLVYSEAVRALLHLTSSDPDTRCLELARPWSPAGLEPGVASRVHASDKARQELDKEESELKDHEIVKLDVVRALIRTDTHLRLRYLLETTKPGPETVTNILGLLTRIAQHSLVAAWSLARTPRLLHIIIHYFLPHNLSPLFSGTPITTMTTVYGVPLRHALQFLRVLASKGRELAALLVNTYEVMSKILIYVSLEPSVVNLPLQEALLLSQEAYSLWAVFLAYGLSKSVESVLSFYPLFVKQLVFYRDRVDVNEATDHNKFNYDVGAQMINTLTRAVNVAASHSLLHARMKQNQGTLLGPDGKSQVLQPPDLTWNDLRDLPHLVETCLAKWLVQISRVAQASFSALRLIGSCCDFLSAYYMKWKDQTSYSAELVLRMVETLYSNVISPSLVTASFRRLLASLARHSCLISTQKPGTERDPINLGSLGCVSFGGEVVPVIQPSSPFPLLLPLSTLLLSLHSLHPALNPASTVQLLDSQEVLEYLIRVCSSQRSLSEHWLARIETHFISNLLQLAAVTDVNRRELYHQTSMCVVTCVHKGDEHLIKVLLTHVICNPKFVPDLSGVSGSVGDLSVRDYEPLKSPALAQPVLTPVQLTATIVQTLPAIGSELSRALITKREYAASAVLKNGIPFVVNGITISHTEFPLCLDSNWPLSPIKHAYKSWQIPQAQKQDMQEYKTDQSSPEDILTVTRCLQMAYLGLKHRRSTVLHSSSHMFWLQHLSLTFLAASDLFLDPTISSYLQGCIAELLKQDGYAKLDPHGTIDCFTSCNDWYKRLAEHYMSVSYGDSTFALYLLVPLQQYLPAEFRTILWSDLCDALQFVYLTSEQIERFLPLRQFHHPAETEEGLIYKYRASLGSGMISATKNSFLHSLALHHTQHYLAGLTAA